MPVMDTIRPYIEYKNFEACSCAVDEGCAQARPSKLLRFSMETLNRGYAQSKPRLAAGQPTLALGLTLTLLSDGAVMPICSLVTRATTWRATSGTSAISASTASHP